MTLYRPPPFERPMHLSYLALHTFLQIPFPANLQLTLALVSHHSIRLSTTNLRVAFPPYSLESLGKDRMRVVVATVHPVRVHGAQVLDLEFDEAGGEGLGVAEGVGEGVYMMLVVIKKDEERY